MDIFYEGKVKETGKQPKRSESTKVGIQIQQASNNHQKVNKKIEINNYAREKTPKHIEESALKAKKISRKLVNLLYRSGAEVIMDDEKYFYFDGDNMLGSARFYTNDKERCFDDVRFYEN